MVSLINDQDGRATLLVTLNHKTADFQQKFALGFACRGKSKISRDVLQELHRTQTWIKNVGVGDIGARQDLEEAPDQQSLARADLAGHDDKTLASLDSVVEGGQGLVVFLRRVQKGRIGSDLEGVPLQIVEALIHDSVPPSRSLPIRPFCTRRR